MRQVVLDTETTGIDPAKGHRVIELAALELVQRKLTGQKRHYYLQPDRVIDPDAQRIHGISSEFLADKPRFWEVAPDFLEFIRDAELLIHNAAFDVGFLNHELSLLAGDWGPVTRYCRGVVDTLHLARRLHPGQKNSLDALCKRYRIDNAARTLHGALLDTELLAEVYLAMTGGQVTLNLGRTSANSTLAAANNPTRPTRQVGPLPVIYADAEECVQHQERLRVLAKACGGVCVWQRLEGAS